MGLLSCFWVPQAINSRFCRKPRRQMFPYMFFQMADVFSYFSAFISQILNLLHWIVLILIFDGVTGSTENTGGSKTLVGGNDSSHPPKKGKVLYASPQNNWKQWISQYCLFITVYDSPFQLRFRKFAMYFQNLKPFTLYAFQVEAVVLNNEGAKSNLLFIKTKEKGMYIRHW